MPLMPPDQLAKWIKDVEARLKAIEDALRPTK